MNDIDLSGINWDPIGDDYTSGFTGVFDGNGHIIKNLTINENETTDMDCVGLFGYADAAELKNVGIINVDINLKEQHRTGGLVGETNGNASISNCYVTGNISTTATQVGGVVGWAEGTVSNCYFIGNVSGNANVAGVSGATTAGCKISNCFSEGTVTGDLQIGGIVGYHYDKSSISNCYTTSKVTGNKSVGAIVGASGNSTVSDSIFDTQKTGQSNAVGNNYGVSNVKGLTSEEMKNPANWAGWDTDVWDTSTFPPSLKNMPAPTPIKGNIRLQIGAFSNSFDNSILFDTSLDLGSFSVDFSSDDSCAGAIDDIDSLMDSITSKRSELGAVANRLDSVLNSNTSSIENLTAAHSTIMDADIAQESADYVKNQILQQTSSALLAQAQNSNSSTLLALIGQL